MILKLTNNKFTFFYIILLIIGCNEIENSKDDPFETFEKVEPIIEYQVKKNFQSNGFVALDVSKDKLKPKEEFIDIDYNDSIYNLYYCVTSPFLGQVVNIQILNLICGAD